MTKTIGSVQLNYKFDNRETSLGYSDGDRQEEELLCISKEHSWDDELKKGDKWHILYHFSPIRQNILEWYPFKKEATLLEVGSGCGALSGMFSRKVGKVVCAELSKRRSLINAYRNRDCSNVEIYIGNFEDMQFEEKFDYITLMGVLEYSALYMSGEEPFDAMLKRIKGLLKPNGILFIAIENKMGIKYLNGAKEDHTGEFYSGIEDYIYRKVRTFSKPELTGLLNENGFSETEFYYPYPDYKLPDTIYSDRVQPREGELRLWGANYDQARLANFNEGIMADQFCRDGMSDYFSNSFLVIAGQEGKAIPDYVHYTNTRKEEYQTRTVIYRTDGIAGKSYLNKVEREYDVFSVMNSLREELNNEFINVNYPGNKITKNGLEYKYIEGKPLEQELYALRHKPEMLIVRFKEIWEKYFACAPEYETDFVVTESYKEIFNDHGTKIRDKSYRYTNPDMLLHNLIRAETEVYCIDYEWVFDFPISRLFTLYRVARDFYDRYMMYFSKYFSRNDFIIQTGIPASDIQEYSAMYDAFGEWVYGDNNYLKYYRKPKGTISIKGL